MSVLGPQEQVLSDRWGHLRGRARKLPHSAGVAAKDFLYYYDEESLFYHIPILW